MAFTTPALAMDVPGQPDPSGIDRRRLRQIDGPVPGYVTVILVSDVVPGGVVPRHTHPGVESTYIVFGGGTLHVDGQPGRGLRAGDSYQIPPGLPHSYRNGDRPTRAVLNYIVQKGKPLTSPA